MNTVVEKKEFQISKILQERWFLISTSSKNSLSSTIEEAYFQIYINPNLLFK